MVSVYSFLYSVHPLWQIFSAVVYGKKFCGGIVIRQTIFVDCVAVLLYRVGKTDRGRNSAGNQCNAPVYDRYVYRSDSACGFGLRAFRLAAFCPGYMVRMADWLDNSDDSVCLLLPEGV